jgi:hypothetical protein
LHSQFLSESHRLIAFPEIFLKAAPPLERTLSALGLPFAVDRHEDLNGGGAPIAVIQPTVPKVRLSGGCSHWRARRRLQDPATLAHSRQPPSSHKKAGTVARPIRTPQCHGTYFSRLDWAPQAAPHSAHFVSWSQRSSVVQMPLTSSLNTHPSGAMTLVALWDAALRVAARITGWPAPQAAAASR